MQPNGLAYVYLMLPNGLAYVWSRCHTVWSWVSWLQLGLMEIEKFHGKEVRECDEKYVQFFTQKKQ